MIETVIHKWLKVPHSLHVGVDMRPQERTDVTVVYIHGLGSSSAMWRDVLKRADHQHTRQITVDLLGFGKSPKPAWQLYSAIIHARSLRMTLRSLNVKDPIVLVGHSLGGLVAIQYATLYPKSVRALVLCSPPFYKPSRQSANKLQVPIVDDVYRSFYQYTRRKKELAVKVAELIKRAKLIDNDFALDEATLPAVVSSLEMSIENQTSLQDAELLQIPVHVLYGLLDPFIVKRNIRELEKKSPHVNASAIMAGHELSSSKIYAKLVTKTVEDITTRIRSS